MSESTTKFLFSFEYKVFQMNASSVIDAKELEVLNLNTFPMKPATEQNQFSKGSHQFQNLKYVDSLFNLCFSIYFK